MVEDSAADAELVTRELRRAGMTFQVDRVETEEGMVARLESGPVDVILADYNLPQFGGTEALAIARARVPDVPFIFVSGSIGEERAVQALKEGAADYVLKDRLARLATAIERACIAARERRIRRESERTIARLHKQNALLLESAGEGIVGLEGDGTPLFVNPAAGRTLGRKANELLGAEGFHDLLGHVRNDGTPCRGEDCPILLTLSDGVLRQVAGESFSRNGGVSFPVDYSVAGVADGEQHNGCVLVFRDVSERQLLERRLEQANRVNSMGRIAATIAHEFNNVLMGIQPFAELLRRRATDEKSIRASEQIMESVKRGKRVTGEILRFTNPAPPTVQGVELNAWLAALVPELAGHLGTRAQLVVESSPRPALALCDALQLQQVITNLVINARDAMSAEGVVTIKVDAPALHPARGLSAAGFVRLTVTDTGCGMPPEVLAKLFEPLFTTKRNGTGLGLAVAHAAITRSGGHIMVESEPGEGTSFHIFLPRDVSEEVL